MILTGMRVPAPRTPRQRRTTIIEGDFGPGYESAYPWDFPPDLNFPTANVTGSHTTLNGNGAFSVTWAAGAHWGDDRWGAVINLPSIPGFTDGYDEWWYTQDFKFVSPFSTPLGFKLMRTARDYSTSQPGNPAGGHSFHTMLGAKFTDTDGPLNAFQYTFHMGAAGQNYYWDSVDGTLGNAGEPIPLDTVARIEMYYKANSAFDVADGIMETRYDVGTATASAEPVTLRAQQTGIQFYGTTEDNRAKARTLQIDERHFFGGNTDPWRPDVDSTVIFGYFKFEIPEVS
jgi:hypothetical protein